MNRLQCCKRWSKHVEVVVGPRRALNVCNVIILSRMN